MSFLIFYKFGIILTICLIFKFNCGIADDKQDSKKLQGYYNTLIKIGALEVNPLMRYVVTIRRNDYETGYAENYICAGVVIATNVILTTAHCLTDDDLSAINKSELIVVGGSPTGSIYHEKAQVKSPTHVIRHEDFEINSYANDVALLFLNSSFLIDRKYIDLVAITSSDPGPHASCKFIGLGAMDYKEEVLFEPLEEELITWPHDLCKLYAIKHNTDESDKICAGDRRSYVQLPCMALASEPLFCHGILYGLSVFDIGCEIKNGFATLYVNIRFHRGWISGKGINFLSSANSIHFCELPFKLLNCVRICNLVVFLVFMLYSFR